MKTSRLVEILVVVGVFLGIYYAWHSAHPSALVPPSFNGTSTVAIATSTKSSPDTSSSTPDTGMILPGSKDKPIVGDNLMLGISGNSKLGTYLIGYTGMTLYTYAKDNVGTSTCYDGCANVWPPYIVAGSDRFNLQYGVDNNKVSTIMRADGTIQVTYRGLPLYFYTSDKAGYDTLGEGRGGLWYVIKP